MTTSEGTVVPADRNNGHDPAAGPPPGFDAPRIEAAVREILIGIGEDPDREGLRDTPARVARAYRELETAGIVDYRGVGKQDHRVDPQRGHQEPRATILAGSGSRALLQLSSIPGHAARAPPVLTSTPRAARPPRLYPKARFRPDAYGCSNRYMCT